jgi:GntR family transcriptional regulator / MocR family aminotransferase
MSKQVRSLTLHLSESSKPVYHRIADALRQALRDGTVEVGSLLPSTRELGSQLKVHRHTVTRSLEELMSEGWLESEPGRGYRVVTGQGQDIVTTSVLWPEFPVLENLSPEQDGDFDFPSGKPDLRLFPQKEFFRVLRQKLRDMNPEALMGYSEPSGSLALRQQLGTYLARMRGLTKGQVMVTHGSQEAILLLGQLLAKGQRRTICVEELGYPPAWDALRLSGAELVGVPVDQDGLRVDVLESIAQKQPPALLYCTPLHQYPTTATLSIERRRHLLEVVAKYRIPVIEDDYDHEFHYSGRPILPLAGEDTSGLVMYVSTFSKLVYPSARLGFCLIPDQLLEPLCRLKRCTTRQNDLLIQETMASWILEGGLERHLRRMRKAYLQRLEVMCEQLDRMALSYLRPHGGMSVWVDLGADCAVTLERARVLGLRIRPGTYYVLEPSPQRPTEVRLGFASLEPEEIRRGLVLLGAAMMP